MLLRNERYRDKSIRYRWVFTKNTMLYIFLLLKDEFFWERTVVIGDRGCSWQLIERSDNSLKKDVTHERSVHNDNVFYLWLNRRQPLFVIFWSLVNQVSCWSSHVLLSKVSISEKMSQQLIKSWDSNNTHLSRDIRLPLCFLNSTVQKSQHVWSQWEEL